MSTRGVIARQTKHGFKGVYHHWDSYPKGLGRSLWQAYRQFFNKDIGKMLVTLIDAHPAGWSTITGKDFSLDIGFKEMSKMLCVVCGKPNWEHYYQNWESHGKRLTQKARQSIAESNYQAFNHTFEYPDDYSPQCYCHGDRKEKAMVVTNKDATDIGCEYAYVFNGNGEMLILSSYNKDDSKMIGMFGYGNPKAEWRTIAVVDLEGVEPEWGKIDN